MSYFLEDAPQQPMAPRGPDQLLSTWMQGVGAAFSQMQRDTNANFQRQHEVTAETAVTVGSVYERLGEAEILRSLKSKSLIPDLVQALPQDAIRYNRAATEAVLQMGRDAQTANPDVWSGVDLSEEGIQKRVTEMRVKDNAEEQQILDLLPNGHGLAEFVGGAAGMIADVRQLPFLAFGGGEGSLLRIIGREAFLNTAAEAVTLPSQFETAKELGKPDPNVPSHLIQAAVGGAALGGALPALGRALEYFRGRSKTPQIIGRNPEHSNIVVTAAEQAIAAGEDPVAAATRAIQELPAEPPPRRPGLIIESRLDPVQGQTPEPLPDPVIIGQAEAAIADAESAFANDFPEMRHKNPLAKKIQSMGGIQASRINPATGAREATQAAQELASMGVTTKTHPFLFRNKGMADLDNIPAADHPGLAEVLKVDSATGYFDRQDILSALAKELTSGTKTAMSGEIAARMAELRRVSDPAARPETDFVSGQQSPTGWFVKPDDYDMFPDGRQMLADSFNKYLADAWPDVKFSDAERAEMLHELQTRGGDAEYLVSRTLERDLQFGEIPKAEAEQYDWIPGFDEPPADGVSRQSGADTGRPGQDGATARGGAEGGAGGQVLEATAAGEQFIAPGIEPVTQRQRLEARQETPMRGGARPMDDGLFDMGARQQMDMFSDPASAEARPILDTMTADIRDEITKGDDFLIDMGDGKGERMASTVLDDLDKGDAAAARFDLCGRGPA
jgi:hypothetical protein